MFDDIYDLTEGSKPDKTEYKCGTCKWASYVLSKETGKIFCERKKDHFLQNYGCGFYSPRTRKI